MGGLKRMIAALGVLAAMAVTLFLLVKVFRPSYVELRTYSDDAGGLPEGSVVRLDGITVGELDRVRLTDSRDPMRKVEFVMKIKGRYLREIPEDSTVGVASTNLLGGLFLNIVRGHSTTPIAAGGELPALRSMDPSKLMAQMGNEFGQIDQIIARANHLLDAVSAGQGNIGKFSKAGLPGFDAASREYDRFMNDLQNAHGNLSKVGDLTNQLQAAQNRLNDVMAGYQAGQGTLGKLQSFSAELDQLTKDFQKLTADLNSKSGPSARLTELQQRFDDLMSRIEKTTDRMNAGQGTLGRLTVNNQFSAALDNTADEFQKLARDIRANPRKFLSLRVQLF